MNTWEPRKIIHSLNILSTCIEKKRKKELALDYLFVFK